MGLDHWLYKMRKADPALVSEIDGMRRSEAFERSCNENGRWALFLVRIGEAGDPDVSDLEACADKVTLVERELDEAKLKALKSVPADAQYRGGSYGPGSASMHYMASDGESYRIDVSDEEYDACSYDVKTQFYACQALELRQWRKRYDIQDAVYRNHVIENCGFHRIDDDETLDELEDLDESLLIPRLRDGEAIVYHEWY